MKLRGLLGFCGLLVGGTTSSSAAVDVALACDDLVRPLEGKERLLQVLVRFGKQF